MVDKGQHNMVVYYEGLNSRVCTMELDNKVDRVMDMVVDVMVMVIYVVEVVVMDETSNTGAESLIKMINRKGLATTATTGKINGDLIKAAALKDAIWMVVQYKLESASVGDKVGEGQESVVVEATRLQYGEGHDGQVGGVDELLLLHFKCADQSPIQMAWSRKSPQSSQQFSNNAI